MDRSTEQESSRSHQRAAPATTAANISTVATIRRRTDADTHNPTSSTARPPSSSSPHSSSSSSSSSSLDSSDSDSDWDSDPASPHHSRHHHHHCRRHHHHHPHHHLLHRPCSDSVASSPSDSKQPSAPQPSFDQLINSPNPLSHLRLAEYNSQAIIRHGLDDSSENPDYLDSISKSYQSYWDQSPYKNIAPSDLIPFPHWTQPQKYCTTFAALFPCLRLGVDPPDILKASPAPNLEAWTNPEKLPKEKVIDTISKRLLQQFESLAPVHTRLKLIICPDVYVEEFKRTLLSLRKNARDDCCLVYYNGHGVPKPTPTGDVWVFNKDFSQYIPIRLYDVLTWVGAPAVFIWDCNNAGQILHHLQLAAGQIDEEQLALEGERLKHLDPNALQPALSSTESNPHQRRSTEPASRFPPSPNATNSPSTSKKPSGNLLQEPWDPSSIRYGHFTSGTIQLAACQPDEMLPCDPMLPADVFTSCLTSPIEMALRFYVLRNNSQQSQWTSTADFFLDLGKLDKVPGQVEMRRTPLGELTWIFNSITDAIAWNHLDRQTFTKVFRGDLLLVSVFRGFLLAERVMKSYGCTPMSTPKLPATHKSEFWHTWDLEVDMCLSQLPQIWKSEQSRAIYDWNRSNYPPKSLPPKIVPYKPSTFFPQQLTAFEVWLNFVVAENQGENDEEDENRVKKIEFLGWRCNDWHGVNINKIDITDFSCPNPNAQPSSKDTRISVRDGKAPQSAGNSSSCASSAPVSPPTINTPDQPLDIPTRYRLPTYLKRFPLDSRKGDDLYPPSPPQLPIVLQVLLSPLHRLRALVLLCRLMDLGPWAVHLSLSIGIYQYVLKLLQAPGTDLKPALIFIWARILTLYPEGRQDLMRCASRPSARPEGPIHFFIKIMAPNSVQLPIVNVGDHQAMCAFIVSITCKNSPANSHALMRFGVLEIIVHRIKELVPWRRQWYLILLAHMWEESDVVKGRAIKMGINTILSNLLTDKVPEVRTAALYAFGTLIGVSTNPKQAAIEDQFPLTPAHKDDSAPKPPDSTPSPSPHASKLNRSVYQTNHLSSLSSSNPDLTRLRYQEQVSIEVGSAMACCHCSTDGSPLFRQELVVVLSALVDQHLGHFIVAAFEFMKQQEREKFMKINDLVRKYQADRYQAASEGLGRTASVDAALRTDGSDKFESQMTDRTAKLEQLINKLKADEAVHPKESLRAYLWMEYTSIYIVLLDLSLDPSEQVASRAKVVIDYIHSRLLGSVLGKLLELGDVGYEEITHGVSMEGNERPSESRNIPLGKRGSRSHTNTTAESPSTSMGSSPVNRDQKERSNSSQGLINRSSVLHSLSTVNNLVPNFVKPSSWKTPFNILSRSPEQSVLNPNDPKASTSTQSLPNPNKVTSDMRKSASFNPITHVQAASQSCKMPPSHNVVSHTSPNSSPTRSGTEGDHRLQQLVSNQSIESILAHTRASDHARRQSNRSYPLQPAFSLPSSSSKPFGQKEATPLGNNTSQQGNKEEEDYLYYLGLHDIQTLQDELSRRAEPSDQKTMLPLISDYYRLSSHVFLKPKMTTSLGESKSKPSGSDNQDGRGDDPRQQPATTNFEDYGNSGRPYHPTGFNPRNDFADDATHSHHLRHSRHVSGSQQHHFERHDGGSFENIKETWRKHRNIKVILDSPTLKCSPIPSSWDHVVCSFDHPKPITNLLMHQFEDQLIASDSSNHITVYDWKSKSILNRFQPSDDCLSWITGMQLINQDSVALLLANTRDGNVRIFRGYERPGKLEVVSAFKGLPNNEPSSLGESGCVTDWQQSTGLLIVGGNSRDMKVWNSRRESCIEELNTRSNSCLTSLSSDHHSGWIISAGFGDGSVRIFDRRKPSKNSMVKVFRSVHSSWCSRIKFQAGHRRELFSGDSTGLISQWDVRLDSPLRTFMAHDEGMPALDLHDHSSLLATGSMNGSVKLWDFKDDLELSAERAPRMIYSLRNLYDTNGTDDQQQESSVVPAFSRTYSFGASMSPLLGNYIHKSRGGAATAITSREPVSEIQPITGLCFHPYRMMIAVADGNGKLKIYSPDRSL
ncbi:hypothetical protein PCANC_18310 [Puccinia coronata f. sp. avenae]|uniref:Raptor N-terminal CASPase-like domain-containing protein n=1 Tax=Puccinia coronata f. sp. avenae TaxID=200324 RepID=A0A2N5UCE6_9BASI|nr:hypothetical protein PCANC_18310 [Puccinia coronata f. sp. avenae]